MTCRLEKGGGLFRVFAWSLCGLLFFLLSTGSIRSAETDPGISLSEAENNWLRDHPVISVIMDPGWPPVEFIDERGQPSGMSEDYLRIIEKRLGIRFKRVPSMVWHKAYEKLKRWEIDMTVSVARTEQREAFWAFTEPYFTIPVVIATQMDVTYISDIRELYGKKVALVSGYAVTDWISKGHPEIQIVTVDSSLEGMARLQRGEVFAYIDNLLIIGYYQAQKKASTIKIAGQTSFANAQCMAVRKDWAPLAGILQKVLATISEEEHNQLYRKWLPIRFEHGFNYTLFWKVLAFFMFTLVGLIFWNRKLVREIRNRKKAEAQRDQELRKQSRLQAELSQAQKMESVGRLAGGVAHDFNNMLGVIIGHADMVLHRLNAESPIHSDILEIRNAAVRSADLTRQLLAFARKQTVEPKVLNINETITGMLNLLRRLIGEDVNLIWLPGTGIWPVRMDPSQVDQILANLCVNARDAIQDVGQITIQTENVSLDSDEGRPDVLPGDYVCLEVLDNGCGMTSETLAHLFEPFFTTKNPGHGTGLGLATVYGAVKQNKGFIKVTSNPGTGSAFFIYLPRYHGAELPLVEKVSANGRVRAGSTILLVEDEETLLQLERGMLERLGYRVLAANSPGEAIHLAEKFGSEISLLLTDVVMPDMNGQDLAVRLTSRYPRLEVLFISGYTADVIAHHGVLDDGVNFIQKPFSMEELADKVSSLIKKGSFGTG